MQMHMHVLPTVDEDGVHEDGVHEDGVHEGDEKRGCSSKIKLDRQPQPPRGLGSDERDDDPPISQPINELDPRRGGPRQSINRSIDQSINTPAPRRGVGSNDGGGSHDVADGRLTNYLTCRYGRASMGGLRSLLCRFCHITLGHRNFWCFAVMSVLAEVQATFNSDFSPIVADVFLRTAIGPDGRAAYLAAEAFAVLIAALAFSMVAQHGGDGGGVRAVYKWATLLKVMTGLVMLLLPPSGVLGASYFFFCTMCTSGSATFWMVLMANVADEHRHLASERYQQPTASVVSLYMGLHALIAKPADSLAPVIGSAALELVGWTGEAMRGPVSPEALAAVYRLVGLLPVCCGVLQLLAWSRFDLYGDRLKQVSSSSAALATSPLSSMRGRRRGGAAAGSESQTHLFEDACTVSAAEPFDLEPSISQPISQSELEADLRRRTRP
uniref:Uncharacterized protein n=1 Tax=Haptolina brevifila TaxID=156173 RepID=A0A7S2JHL0_9EUKA|mmetsp:Transcript_82633/g.164916  ORF Transcript_82633/g.164916 Transcript_82633/m.164916 type:complete len:440 (+) Transcript_82633:198-1517(+)